MSEKIALGFCNNIDYEIVWNADILEDLVQRHKIRAGELSRARQVNSERDLVISILGFMQEAAGGERFVAESALIEHFARRFDKRITLGGTSVRAAIAMRKLGYTSALHLITQNDHVRRLIPPDSPYVCSNAEDTSYPHLIVQYPKDARIRAADIDIHVKLPNRLIYHCNADRIALKLCDDFADLITDAKALLVSGFNAMQSERLLAERLESVDRMIACLPADATVFVEDGGYFYPGFREIIYRRLGRRIGIFGMNEDELQTRLRRKIALDDAEQVLASLAAMKRMIPAASVVVHTRHWAAAYGENARSLADALKAGVTMATTRFRYGDNFTLANYREIKGAEASANNKGLADSINSGGGPQVVCVPVPAVAQANGTTIGLGDAFVGGFLPALLAQH